MEANNDVIALTRPYKLTSGLVDLTLTIYIALFVNSCRLT